MEKSLILLQDPLKNVLVTDDIPDPSNIEEIEPSTLNKKSPVIFASSKSAPLPAGLETPACTKVFTRTEIPAKSFICDGVQTSAIVTELQLSQKVQPVQPILASANMGLERSFDDKQTNDEYQTFIDMKDAKDARIEIE